MGEKYISYEIEINENVKDMDAFVYSRIEVIVPNTSKYIKNINREYIIYEDGYEYLNY